MKNSKKALTVILAAAMSTSLLAACGSSSSSSTTAASSASATSSAAATSSEAAAPAASGETVTFRVSSQHAETNQSYTTLKALCDEVTELTDGRVQFELYANSTLGAAAENLTMLDNDVCDICWTSAAFFAGQFPISNSLELPMMGIQNSIDATNIYWDLMETYPEAFSEFDDYYVWTAYTAPATIVGVTNKQIASISDLAGLNLRSSAGVNSDVVSAWGAAPLSIAPSDLYMSLEKGVADGYLFNASTLDSWKLGELTQCAFDCQLGYSQIFVLMSLDDYNKLSDEDKAIMDQVGKRAGSIMEAENTEAEAQTAIDNYLARGGDVTYNVLSSDDTLYQELKAPLDPIIQQWVADTTTDSFDTQQIVDFISEKAAEYAG